jgi:hypothetical protein
MMFKCGRINGALAYAASLAVASQGRVCFGTSAGQKYSGDKISISNTAYIPTLTARCAKS